MREHRTVIFDLDELHKPGTLIFVLENGKKIGLGSVIANNDEGMFVDVDFTVEPSADRLEYGLVSDFIDDDGR